jgi:hypothetical protein
LRFIARVLLGILLCAGISSAQAGVEREWRARRRALFPSAHAEELLAAIGHPDWPERAAAFDALARGLEAGGELLGWHAAAIVAGLADPHPTVRVFALRTLVAEGPWGALDSETARRLSTDRLPAVRLELARALASIPLEPLGESPGKVAVEILARLARDPDPRVADAARAALLAGSDQPSRIDLLGHLLAEGSEEEILRGFLRVGRGPAELSPLLDAIGVELEGRDRKSRAWRAVVEALSLIGGSGGDLDRLLDGWLGTGLPSPRRQRLFAQLGESRNAALGEALLEALEALECRGEGPFTSERWPGLAEDLRETIEIEGAEAVKFLPHELADLVVRTLGPVGLLEVTLEREWTASTLVRLFGSLGHHLSTWPRPCRVWIEPGVDLEVRAAAIEALAATFSRSGDRSAGDLLALALEDPDAALGEVAWRALCDDPQGEAWHGELVEAWRKLPLGEALERLNRMTRDRPFPAFRDELLALGSRPDDRRLIAAELLAPFRGDEGVRQALESWLGDDLRSRAAALARGDRPTSERVELRIGVMVQSLGGVAPVEGCEMIERALIHSLGNSTDLGKVAVAVLGFTGEGRDRLPRYLGRQIDRRTRVEAAIVLGRRGDGSDRSAAGSVLIGDFPAATWDLAARMIGALGRVGDGPSLAFLGELVRGGEEEERGAALRAIAARGDEPALAFLRETAREGIGFDVRRLAVRLLGESEEAEMAVFLAELFGELFDGRIGDGRIGEGRIGEGWSAEERHLLRSELLSALGATGAFPERLEGEWLLAPLAAARASLEKRFRGEDIASAHFSWSGELELAEHLTRSGRIDEALARTPRWWRLDGRVLVALAERSAAAASADRSVSPRRASWILLRAGLVALLGEHRRNPRRLAIARGVLLEFTWREGEWEAFDRLASSLLRDYRSGALAEATWRIAVGPRNHAGELDPLARLECGVWQARARSALERGDVESARFLARQAAPRVGASRRAAERQALLQHALGGD